MTVDEGAEIIEREWAETERELRRLLPEVALEALPVLRIMFIEGFSAGVRAAVVHDVSIPSVGLSLSRACVLKSSEHWLNVGMVNRDR